MSLAVLVMDVQSGLFDKSPRPFEADKVIQRINHVTSQARDSAIPVIFIQAEQPGFLEYEGVGWGLAAGLTVEDVDLRLRKTTSDPFHSSNLKETLTSIGAKNLIVCGYASEFCIDTTIRRASGLGYTVQLVSDAHTTHDKEHLSARLIREHHNATLSMSPKVTAVLAADINLRD